MKLKKIDFVEVDCNLNIDLVTKLGLSETPVIIDEDGKRYVGANCASEYINEHNL